MIAIVEWLTAFAIVAHGIVLAIIADATGLVSRCDENGLVKMTPTGMIVTVAF